MPLLVSLKAFLRAIEQSSRPVSSALLEYEHMYICGGEGGGRENKRIMRLKSAGHIITTCNIMTCDTDDYQAFATLFPTAPENQDFTTRFDNRRYCRCHIIENGGTYLEHQPFG